MSFVDIPLANLYDRSFFGREFQTMHLGVFISHPDVFSFNLKKGNGSLSDFPSHQPYKDFGDIL